MGVGQIVSYSRTIFNPNRSLDRICLDLLLPSCFLTALVRLSASALPFHLDVARYAFDETSAHLLNNRTKSVKESNDRFGFNQNRSIDRGVVLLSKKRVFLLPSPVCVASFREFAAVNDLHRHACYLLHEPFGL